MNSRKVLELVATSYDDSLSDSWQERVLRAWSEAFATGYASGLFEYESSDVEGGARFDRVFGWKKLGEGYDVDAAISHTLALTSELVGLLFRNTMTGTSSVQNAAKKTHHDVEKALEIWRGLVAGRWSLVDHFDSDGKRFVLAVKNAHDVAPRRNLTEREARVAALAAMGHRDKEIAYILGLEIGAVASALHRARVKLGVKSRSELATTWRRDASAAME